MKKVFTFLFVAFISMGLSFGQDPFIPAAYDSTSLQTVVLPKSPIKSQILFVGGVDHVQVVDAQGQPNGEAIAKQWHDFIGFTADDESSDLGWVSVNHEMTIANDSIGDGGGMTAFKIKREGDSIVIVDQTLSDGRTGKFFNVDFVNTTGNTGMNCGGIVSPADGRIWTAEEWWRGNNSSIAGFMDTADFSVSNSGITAFDGNTIKGFENFNYMVEIDPREAKAVRKQYNWGRQPYEGGVVMADNKTVYTGSDATPGFFTKFVADVAGDFTSGTTYVYKHDAPTKWVEIDNSVLANMLHFSDTAVAKGATMFNRLEWVATNKLTGKVYMTETGRDNPGGRWRDEAGLGAVHALHTIERANAQGTHPDSSDYEDFYGRVLEFDPATDEFSVYLEGGPSFDSDVAMADYPEKHLSNPDGLNFYYKTEGGVEKAYMLICEDLNGTSNGRVPEEYSFNNTCELWMLSMDVEASVDNLNRIAIMPRSAEVTGVIAIDEKTILVNSQHPTGDLSRASYPYNNSLTLAFSGWDAIDLTTGIDDLEYFRTDDGFAMYPNPAFRELHFNDVYDIEVYDISGKQIMSKSQVSFIQVYDLKPGIYFVRNNYDDVQKLVVK